MNWRIFRFYMLLYFNLRRRGGSILFQTVLSRGYERHTQADELRTKLADYMGLHWGAFKLYDFSLA